MLAIGNFLFRYRNALFPFAVLLLFLPGPRLASNPLLPALIGAVITALGQLVRAGTIGLVYVIRGGRNRRVYAEKLVTDGIYAHCRNPMYVGNVLIVIGLAVASNALWTFIIGTVLSLFFYSAIITAEEDFLRRQFGPGFDEYCRNVPRWLPKLGGLGATLGSSEFHWRRLLVKEYGTPVGWINALILITLYNLWRAGLWDQYPLLVRSLIALSILSIVFWLVAWRLKKSRRILPD